LVGSGQILIVDGLEAPLVTERVLVVRMARPLAAPFVSRWQHACLVRGGAPGLYPSTRRVMQFQSHSSRQSPDQTASSDGLCCFCDLVGWWKSTYEAAWTALLDVSVLVRSAKLPLF